MRPGTDDVELETINVIDDHAVQPTFSIVMPSYNTERFIGDAILSVARQHYQPVELVIVDDGSTDETAAAVEAYQERFAVPILLLRQRNQGAGAARNAGVAAAVGEWIVFLDSDDVLEPNALAAFATPLHTFPDAQWIGGDFSVVDEDDRAEIIPSLADRQKVRELLGEAFEDRRPLRLEDSGPKFIRVSLTAVGALAVRRDFFCQAGGFDESLRQAQDYHLWIRLAHLAPFHFVPEKVFRYRQRAGSKTNSGMPPRIGARAAFHALCDDKCLGVDHDAISERLNEFYVTDSIYCARKGRFRSALRLFWQARRYGRLRVRDFYVLAKALLKAVMYGAGRWQSFN
ncbi:glycosyltransferase [Rhodovibrio salinarum]|uniref:Glycosyltransferase 2-like domain-containing protein n=1 Tax=Rhodovibrio salinarum TaxID=1087 RepID=A0A934QFE1_9PROT|nr:glycosyltransferase [Rhodovibrio salinarum]MBK1696037.1 hypothetical protein [Rhodovibrio salinarum]